jgi:hypothetical protein
MRTLKAASAILMAIVIGISPYVMAAGACQDQAASTTSGSTCDLLCTQECSGAWTISYQLWCKPSPGYSCETASFDPPINLTIHHAFGTCGWVLGDCKCVIDPGTTWTDVQLTFWYKTTTPCGG